MKLLYDRDIQLLLRDQNTDVSAPKRWRHTHIEQRLTEGATPHAKSLYSIFTSPVTGLNTGWYGKFDLRPDNRTENKPLPGRLLET
jgi:hypothetical protein